MKKSRAARKIDYELTRSTLTHQERMGRVIALLTRSEGALGYELQKYFWLSVVDIREKLEPLGYTMSKKGTRGSYSYHAHKV